MGTLCHKSVLVQVWSKLFALIRKMVFDCHLMVANPEHHLEDFARAGADIISIHVEATPHIHGALQKIRSLGVKPSVVINPGTPVEAINTCFT